MRLTKRAGYNRRILVKMHHLQPLYIYKLHVINFAPNMNRSEVEYRKANKATVEEDCGT